MVGFSKAVGKEWRVRRERVERDKGNWRAVGGVLGGSCVVGDPQERQDSW